MSNKYTKDFGLSLSGSQIGTPTSISRRGSSGQSSTRSSARGDQSMGARQKTTSHTKKSARSDRHNGNTDDFLALFDTAAKPKPKSSKPTPKKAWAQSTARSGTSGASKHTQGSKFSHSVFEPVSARTTSTIDGDEELYSSRRETKTNNGSENPLHLAIPGRQSGHGENDLFSSSRLDSSSDKATKLNSIANNMSSLALSPSTKAPFHGMENSYQNIKHKHPVNQVKQNISVGRNVAEDYIKKCNMAATQIQRWFRRHSARSKAGEAALRRLLESKKQEKIEEKVRESLTENKPKSRDERARQARLEAIEELQKKREQRRQHNQGLVEEEMKFLQESGKVSSTPAAKSNVKKKSLPKKTAPVPQRTSPRSPVVVEEKDEQVSPQVVEEEKEPSMSQAETKTTLEDLMETLKKLEEDDHLGKASGGQEKNEKPLEWLDDLENMQEDKDKDNLKKSGFLTDEKLQNIISYLDEVETAEILSELDQELQSDVFRPVPLVPSQDELAAIEQASQQAAEVTSSMLTQKLELEEKRRTVQMLQKALNQQRELTVRHAKETEKEMKKRLDVQKDEYEETIKRHLSFIDQLIDDKKALSEKCESLVTELKTIDKKYTDKLKAMQQAHDVEMQKIKDVHAAAEKLRREKWIDEKTKKIKEMTVKGLEPEIQRLIAKHKAEIKKLKSIHEAELLASDERAGGRYIRMTEELRDQLAREKEAACARERDLARQTYDQQTRAQEEALQQQRRRMNTELQEERDRLATQAAKQRAEIERRQQDMESTNAATITAMREEYEKSKEEQEKRHVAEVKHLKEQLAIEKQAWEQNYMKKQEAWATQKERELKDSVRKDRDREIELVIKQLEEDNQSAREECERVAENRIKRIRDKYEAEMAEIEHSERVTMEKYNQNKAQLAEYEGENERLKVTLRQKDREVAEIKKLLDKLNDERDHVSDVIRQEFADRIISTEEENRRVKNEMSELKARHRLEMEKAKAEIDIVIKQKEEEMEEVHKRVKQAILKKEEVVSQIKQQYQAALKRADHLEGLMEQQRKQLLGKK